MTPNKIAGMRLRGIGRAPSINHIKKAAKTYLKYTAIVRKNAREQAQYERANREYLV